MKLNYPLFPSSILIDDTHLPCVIVENPNEYSKMISSLFTQLKGLDGEFILFDDVETLSIKKTTEIIINPFELNFSSKKITDKIYHDLTELAESSLTIQTMEMKSTINTYIENLLSSYDIPVAVDSDVSLQILFKGLNVRFDNEDTSMMMQISKYMELLTNLKLANLFIFVNLQSFISDKELKKLYKYAQLKKLNILLLENKDYKSISKQEYKLIIDQDLCVVQNDYEVLK